jgi:type I restriction enzyme R subunit
LAHVAYAVPLVAREVRASNARININSSFNEKQQAFLDFVLQHYVQAGVEELDQEKLTPLLRLNYNGSIADAVADLGPGRNRSNVCRFSGVLVSRSS